MSSLSAQNSRSSSPAPSSGVTMPPVSNAATSSIQQYQQNQLAIAHMSEIKMPPASIGRQGGGEHSSESSGVAGPSHTPPPLQVSFWEARNGPVDQIMRHIGNAIVTLLKLFTPKKGI